MNLFLLAVRVLDNNYYHYKQNNAESQMENRVRHSIL